MVWQIAKLRAVTIFLAGIRKIELRMITMGLRHQGHAETFPTHHQQGKEGEE